MHHCYLLPWFSRQQSNTVLLIEPININIVFPTPHTELMQEVNMKELPILKNEETFLLHGSIPLSPLYKMKMRTKVVDRSTSQVCRIQLLSYTKIRSKFTSCSTSNWVIAGSCTWLDGAAPVQTTVPTTFTRPQSKPQSKVSIKGSNW